MATSHVLSELGLEVRPDVDDLRARVEVSPMMNVPGTSAVRASVLAAVADTVLGLLSIQVIAPRVPVTLALDVFLAEPIVGVDTIEARATVTKSGSTVTTSTIEFADPTGRRLAAAHSMFTANPDPRVTMPTGSWALDSMRAWPGDPLPVPYAERVGCVRVTPGVASLPMGPRVGNQSNTLNGGILPLAAEEAALSALPAGHTAGSIVMRFLRPVRVGPAVARAETMGAEAADLAEVAITDAESGALAALATIRSMPTTGPPVDPS